MKVRKIIAIVVLSVVCSGCGFKGPLAYDDNTTTKPKEWPETNQGPITQNVSTGSAEGNPESPSFSRPR